MDEVQKASSAERLPKKFDIFKQMKKEDVYEVHSNTYKY